jgi:hypothetical protein
MAQPNCHTFIKINIKIPIGYAPNSNDGREQKKKAISHK